MEETEKGFSVRERLALWCLFLIIKVVKPMRWDADYKEEFSKVKELIELQ